MNHVLYLSAIPLAAALPIHNVPATSNGVTLLVVFTTLSTLTFLCVSKTLFRKSRRSWFTRLAALTPTSVHTQPRPGLLVGFLGSPTWETCLTLNVHKTLHERRRSFFAVDYPLARTSSKYWHSSLNFRDSNTSPHRRLPPISSFGQASLVYQSEKGTVLFTPRPPPALYDSSRVTPRRRYTLPSVVQYAQHGQVKRSYSTKARRVKHRRPDVNSISFAPVSPAKVLSDSVAHIFPLPFSPFLDARSSERYPMLRGSALDSPSPSTQRTNRGGNETICSPMDGASKILQVSITEPEPTADCKSTTRDNQASSCETVDFLSPLVPGASPNASTDPDDEPLPPLNSVVMFKLRPRYKVLSVRTKRSPPLGPSPLRTMILPENSGPDLSSRTSREDPSMMTLCEPNIFGPDVGALTSGKKRVISNSSPRTIEDHDPDPLLGLIRELAEEANDWDESLFMDKNFKSMIEDTQDAILKKESERVPSNLPVVGPCSGFDSFTESPTEEVTRSRDIEYAGSGQLLSFWEVNSKHRDEIGIAR